MSKRAKAIEEALRDILDHHRADFPVRLENAAIAALALSEEDERLPELLADIESEIAHIKENGMRVAAFGGDQDIHEGRCRELCAMYLGEFILAWKMKQRLEELERASGAGRADQHSSASRAAHAAGLAPENAPEEKTNPASQVVATETPEKQSGGTAPASAATNAAGEIAAGSTQQAPASGGNEEARPAREEAVYPAAPDAPTPETKIVTGTRDPLDLAMQFQRERDEARQQLDQRYRDGLLRAADLVKERGERHAAKWRETYMEASAKAYAWEALQQAVAIRAEAEKGGERGKA